MAENFALAKAQDRISELETAIKAALGELEDNSEIEAVMILKHALKPKPSEMTHEDIKSGSKA
jgi:hypothetical protein